MSLFNLEERVKNEREKSVPTLIAELRASINESNLINQLMKLIKPRNWLELIEFIELICSFDS